MKLADQIANMMQNPLKPAGSGPSEVFDRTVFPPRGSTADSLELKLVDSNPEWGWLDVEHQHYWHRLFVFMAEQGEPEKGLAGITLTEHFRPPVGFEEVLDIERQMAFSIIVASGPEQLSRRALGQEFCEPKEIIQQIKGGQGAANVMVDAVQNKNFLAHIDNCCRMRNKTQSAGYVLDRYRNEFKFLSMLGYREQPVKDGFLWVRDIAEVE